MWCCAGDEVPNHPVDATFRTVSKAKNGCSVCWTVAISNVLNYSLRRAAGVGGPRRVATRKVYSEVFTDTGYHTYAPITRAARAFFRDSRAILPDRVDHFASALADELRAGRLVIIEIKTVNGVGHALTALGFRTERELDGTFTAIVAFTDVFYGGARGNTIEAELFYGSPDADEDGKTPKASLSLKLLGGVPGHKIAITGATACGAPKDDVLRKVLAPLAAAAPDA